MTFFSPRVRRVTLLILVGVCVLGKPTATASLEPNGYAWGFNVYGQLGSGVGPNQRLPTAISSDVRWQSVAAGGSHSCGISSSVLWCWGRNEWGQLGDGTRTLRDVPVTVAHSTGWVQVSTGNNHTCAIDVENALWCWGDTSFGQVGGGAMNTMQLAPLNIAPGSQWRAIGAGAHTCGIKTDLTLWCWGFNGFGQLGDGTFTSRNLPVQIASPERTWVDLSVGLRHTCLVDDESALWCWGHNGSGELGDGSYAHRPRPTRVAPGRSWSLVSAGVDRTCAIATGGSLWCWGEGESEEPGGYPPSTTPIEKANGTTWQAVSVGEQACGIVAGGVAFCWGPNGRGQLGNGTTLDADIPQPVGGQRTWVTLSTGFGHVLALAETAPPTDVPESPLPILLGVSGCAVMAFAIRTPSTGR